MKAEYDSTHKPGEPGDFEFAGYVVEAEVDRDTGAVQIHDVLRTDGGASGRYLAFLEEALGKMKK